MALQSTTFEMNRRDGIAGSGGTARVEWTQVTGSWERAPVFDASGNLLANPLTADSAGRVSCYLLAGDYRVVLTLDGETKTREFRVGDQALGARLVEQNQKIVDWLNSLEPARRIMTIVNGNNAMIGPVGSPNAEFTANLNRFRALNPAIIVMGGYLLSSNLDEVVRSYIAVREVCPEAKLFQYYDGLLEAESPSESGRYDYSVRSAIDSNGWVLRNTSNVPAEVYPGKWVNNLTEWTTANASTGVRAPETLAAASYRWFKPLFDTGLCSGFWVDVLEPAMNGASGAGVNANFRGAGNEPSGTGSPLMPTTVSLNQMKGYSRGLRMLAEALDIPLIGNGARPELDEQKDLIAVNASAELLVSKPDYPCTFWFNSASLNPGDMFFAFVSRIWDLYGFAKRQGMHNPWFHQNVFTAGDERNKASRFAAGLAWATDGVLTVVGTPYSKAGAPHAYFHAALGEAREGPIWQAAQCVAPDVMVRRFAAGVVVVNLNCRGTTYTFTHDRPAYAPADPADPTVCNGASVAAGSTTVLTGPDARIFYYAPGAASFPAPPTYTALVAASNRIALTFSESVAGVANGTDDVFEIQVNGGSWNLSGISNVNSATSWDVYTAGLAAGNTVKIRLAAGFAGTLYSVANPTLFVGTQEVTATNGL